MKLSIKIIPVVAAIGITGCSPQGLMPVTWGNGGSLGSGSGDGGGGGTSLGDPQLQDKALTILQKNCASCHGAGSGPQGVYGLGDVNHMIAAGLIVPGVPTSSSIYNAIKSGTMPPGGALSAGDTATIANWITSLASPSPGGPGGGGNPTPTPTPPPPASGTFANLEATILVPKCVACHSKASAAKGYAFDSYAGVMKAVNTTNPSNSKIYKETSSGSMPPSPSPKLTASELNTLLTWIQAGAPNN